jgi:hypothetical protein
MSLMVMSYYIHMSYLNARTLCPDGPLRVWSLQRGSGAEGGLILVCVAYSHLS